MNSGTDTIRSTSSSQHITKTCLYNFDPLKPHLYIVKLGFTGVYIIFIISAQKYRLWVLVRTEPSRRGGSNECPQSMFLSRKNIRNYIRKFSFFGGKIFNLYLKRRVFEMFKEKARQIQLKSHKKNR